jgi:hypothetical protein
MWAVEELRRALAAGEADGLKDKLWALGRDVPKVDKARMMAWIDAAIAVGRWPASIDGRAGKFDETAAALRDLVNRTHLKIEVVHKFNEPGPGDNHRPATKEPWLDSALKVRP